MTKVHTYIVNTSHSVSQEDIRQLFREVLYRSPAQAKEKGYLHEDFRLLKIEPTQEGFKVQIALDDDSTIGITDQSLDTTLLDAFRQRGFTIRPAEE